MRQLTDEQKKARGTDQPCRATGEVVEFPKTTTVPEPPKWLNRDGKALWREVAPHLHAQRILTTADLQSLGHLCQLHGDVMAGYRHKQRPTAAELAQLRMYFGEFGMTPASRTKVKTNGESAKGNAFSRNGRKSQASAD